MNLMMKDALKLHEGKRVLIMHFYFGEFIVCLFSQNDLML